MLAARTISSSTVLRRTSSSSSSSRLTIARAAVASAEASSADAAKAAPVVFTGALADARFSKLRQALEVTELTGALTGALTVFAPTDAAFEKMSTERSLSFEELAQRDNLKEILTYHVLPSAVKAETMKSGEAKTLNGRSMTVVSSTSGGVTVDGVKVVEADKAEGDVVVHVVDEVVFPAFSINAKVQTPQEILSFEGWAPEVINGRVAMIGFVLALGGEFATGQSFTTQAFGNFGEVLHTAFVWSLASLAPAFSSNEGYEANPKKIAGSKEWQFVIRGSPIPELLKVLTPEAEMTNGRAAMVGIASMIVLETLMGHALF
jgi:uncharacterized surface protein with fasciclin (FAS1) repeats|mmetsp:Transcript_8477/g.28438  ORF Transcript_8477/g.28438 Transcript_8477/m.28438 type:complete len:320 (-) Transcript_8477:4581-5540(-)